MIGKVLAMLNLGRKLERPTPDPIQAQVVIAAERQRRAGETARQLLAEMLDRSDDLKGNK